MKVVQVIIYISCYGLILITQLQSLPLMKHCFIVLGTLSNTTNSETVQDHGNDVD